jgi:hypothetical protein
VKVGAMHSHVADCLSNDAPLCQICGGSGECYRMIRPYFGLTPFFFSAIISRAECCDTRRNLCDPQKF